MPREPQNWFRELQDDRLEVCLRADGLKVRASGNQDDIFAIVEWFEDRTGKTVQGGWRRPPRRGPRPLDGQLAIEELSPAATVPA